MKTYAYDVEVYKNLFTATFVNVENKKEEHVFYIGIDKSDWKDLSSFLKEKILLVGYNNHSYDDPVLRFITTYTGDNILSELFSLSSKLIDDNYRSDKEILKLRYPRDVYFHWNSIDLMRIMGFDKLGISLKQVAISLKWHMIMDLPIEPHELVRKDQLDLIIRYNLNDVLITKRLYEEIEPERKLRNELSKLYGINLTSASDSKMANLILENIYSQELGMDMSQVKKMRTYRDRLLLKECIAPFVSFETEQLKELLDRISVTYVHNHDNYKYSEKINYGNCTFALGVGGLHSEDSGEIFETDEDYIIQDMDVASYYPNLIINNNFYPQHLGEGFIKVLKKITQERLNAKASGDKVKADGLKITINSIFGKLGMKDFWLFDPKQLLSTTVSGQLGLLMLIESLHENGIHVISANTDGVVCKIPRKLEEKYYEVAKQWEEKTGLSLEYTPYKKYVRRDVNSYITEKPNGQTKEKGVFLTKIDLKKAYKMPVVSKALYAYFIKGTPVLETLENTKDVMEFCISQKMGANFTLEYHTATDVEILQKTNRFYVSNKGGSLIKRHKYRKSTSALISGYTVGVLNNYDENVPFEEYDINFTFYEKEVMKIIDVIEPKQVALFDFTGISGTKTKMDFNGYQKEDLNRPITVNELNKLGKNQLITRIETIVRDGKKIENISPRYVFITDFNPKIMKAEIYSLGKGVTQTIDVDRKAYNKDPLEKGKLVYCEKFKKLTHGFTIAEYRITEKIEEDKQTLI